MYENQLAPDSSQLFAVLAARYCNLPYVVCISDTILQLQQIKKFLLMKFLEWWVKNADLSNNLRTSKADEILSSKHFFIIFLHFLPTLAFLIGGRNNARETPWFL